jgi:hypothetical protein
MRFRQIREKTITVIKLRMNDSCGNDTSSRLLDGTLDTFEITDMTETRFRNSRYVVSESKIRIEYDTQEYERI